LPLLILCSASAPKREPKLRPYWSDLLGDISQQGRRSENNAVLVEAGFTLHDCDGVVADKALGGYARRRATDAGVIVRWTQHDRVAVDEVRGLAVHAEVQAVMNDSLFQVLQAMGFAVEPFGPSPSSSLSSPPPESLRSPAGGVSVGHLLATPDVSSTTSSRSCRATS